MDTVSVCGKEYEIIKLLGHGKGGYSYLAKELSGSTEGAEVSTPISEDCNIEESTDVRCRTDGTAEVDGKELSMNGENTARGNNSFVVLKQIHHEPCAYYTFGNKIEAERHDYARLVEAGIRIPKMIAIDTEGERIVKEFIDGPTVSELVRDSDGEIDEGIILQARDMAEKARSHGLNIDYYPTNFVLQDGLLYYVDYECNQYSDEWNFENWGIKYWSKTDKFLEHLKANAK